VAPPAVPTRTEATPGSGPISPTGLVAARRAAARFLAGYLPFIYGRGSARSIDAVTPDMRLQLSRMRASVTPVECQRHPRVVSLSVVGQAADWALVTALVADGGVTTYVLRIVLSGGRGGWIVNSVDGG
jgi:hypothetical protein